MNPQQSEKNVLFFSDLPQNVVQSDLDLFLQDYKDSIVVINLEQKNQSSDFSKTLKAKVVFKDTASANKVRLEQNLKKIKGYAVRIMWDERDSSIRYNTKSNLFIKGIPPQIKPREVYEYFMKFGDIFSLKIQEDEIGNHLDYGYLTYYNPEDAEKVILASQKENIFGVKLEVSRFQKKNERNFESNPSNSRALYIKNFPDNFKKEALENLCSKYGHIENIIIHPGSGEFNYCIATYTSDEETKKALEGLSTVTFEDGKNLFVQYLQNKYERKQFLQNQIRENNHRLNEQFHLCNLHIRNIPYTVTENDLRKAFEKFGNIVRLKIETFILQTKESDKLKETPTSKGFGYICFDNQESAKAAMEAYNGKYLQGFESWNRPILIDYFMPKQQRRIFANQSVIGSSGMTGMYPLMTPYSMPMMPLNNPHIRNPMPGYMPRNQLPKHFPHHPRQQQFNPQFNRPPLQQQQPLPQQQNKPKPSLFDMNVLNSLEDENEKRDYLGEVIYKTIEYSPLADKYQMTTDQIGKITGMIIQMENIEEVIATVKDEESLNARIEEGLNLIKNSENK